MDEPIERVTMFKVSSQEDREKILDQYKIMAKTAVKVPTRPPIFSLQQTLQRTEDHCLISLLQC
jgi:hypothetical protein